METGYASVYGATHLNDYVATKHFISTQATETRNDNDAPMTRSWAQTHLQSLMGPPSSLRRHLTTAMAGSFALILASKVLMLGVTVLLARYMGAHDYGVYASALAAVTLIGVPASLGLPNLIVREVAVFHSRAQWGYMRGLLKRCTQAILVVSILLGIVLYFVQGHFAASRGYSHALLWITYALVPVTLLVWLPSYALRGLRHIALGLLPEWLLVPVIFIAGVIVVHGSSPATLTPAVAIALRFAAVAVAFVAGTFFLFRRLPQQVMDAAPVYQSGVWLRAALPMMWVGSMNIITTQTDVLMLAGFRGPTDAGTYQVAARGAELVAFISTIATIALQPTISRLYTNGELMRLRKITKYAARIMLATALLAALFYILVGGTLLRIIFGSAFEAAAPALSILSIGWVLIAAMGPARDTLLMCDGERESAIVISLAAVLNVLFNLLLIPPLGTTGAAIATGASLIVCHLGYTFYVRRRLGFWLSPL